MAEGRRKERSFVCGYLVIDVTLDKRQKVEEKKEVLSLKFIDSCYHDFLHFFYFIY